METRITYAEYEVLRMEHLLKKWVRKLGEYPRIDPEEWKTLAEEGAPSPVPGQLENEKWAWESLQMLSEQTTELLELGKQRREGMPREEPSHFILVRQPIPYGKTLADVVTPREMNAPPVVNRYPDVPMGEGSMPKYLTWPYYEPYCHPVRHVRAFGYGIPYQSKGVFALLTPDYAGSLRVPDRSRPATFGLCYDWIVPINWHLDLRAYEVWEGPYAGRNAFEHKAQVSCLRYCHVPGRLIKRDKVINTHVPIEWAMHLVPPYAVEFPRKVKKRKE